MTTPENKIRSLVFIIAFLLITNAIMLVLFIINKDGKRSSRTGDVNLVQSFLKTDLQFDDRQMAVYQKLRKEHFDRAALLFEEIRGAKSNFYQNVYNNNPQDSMVNKLALGIGEKQIALDKHMLRYFQNIRELCTPAQLPKFDSSFKNVVEKIISRRLKKNTANNH